MKNWKWFAFGLLAGCLLLLLNHSYQSNAAEVKNMISSLQSLPVEKKTLSIGRTGDSISLDPAVVTDQESLMVTINIYDTLVRYDRNGLTLKPGLATRWEVSEDGLIWKFYIRRDVHFHDGTLLDAEAVVFNFNRWMDINSPYHAGHFTYWNMSFGGYPGIVESVQALSSDTVEIVLKKPYAPFLSTLAMPAFGIASPDAIIKYNEDLKVKPVGTGPFVFKSWSKEGEITLERNPSYWDEIAKVDRLVFKTIDDEDERIQQLIDQDIQIAYNLTNNEVSKALTARDIELTRRPYFNVGYLAMNMNNPYMYQKSVRQAIGHLIDKSKMMDTTFDFSARPANTFVPPVIWGYNETIESLSFDVNKAKDLLAQNGLEKGFTVKLLVMEEPRMYFPKPVALAFFIKDSLSKAGINVIIDAKPWADVIKDEQRGNYDMVLAGWNGDVADPDNFLYTFFSSENAKEGVVSNYAYYQNPQVDMLLTQARQATDKSFRNSLYREIQELIYNDTPAIPLVHTMPAIGIHKSITGYVPHISGVEPLNHVDFVKEP